MLAAFGDQTPVDGATINAADIPQLDADFWQARTEALEALALSRCSDQNIDGMFYEVTSIIDEDLTRFDPMVAYFGRYYPDGDPVRIEIESEIAACVKRDLSWMMVEWLIQAPGFFTGLKTWYDLGRWPHGWDRAKAQILVK
ncbi:MAG: hypothetical protein WCJ09_16340 [Planctomycetota bacterium]